jgi:hypothetical protein
MEVIRHEAKCMDDQESGLNERSDAIEKLDPIAVIPESRTAPDTSGHDVIESAWKFYADWSGHIFLPVNLTGSGREWSRIFWRDETGGRLDVFWGEWAVDQGLEGRALGSERKPRAADLGQKPNTEDLAPSNSIFYFRVPSLMSGQRLSSSQPLRCGFRRMRRFLTDSKDSLGSR